MSSPDITPIAELFEGLVELAENAELRINDAGYRSAALAWTLRQHLRPNSGEVWNAQHVAQCAYTMLVAGDRQALAPIAPFAVTALTDDPPGPETPAGIIRYAYSDVGHVPRQSALRGDVISSQRTPELVRRLALWLAFDEFTRNLNRTDARLASRSASAFRPERSSEVSNDAELSFRGFLTRSRQEGIMGALNAALELDSPAKAQTLRVPDAAWLIAWDEAVRAGADAVCSELAGHRARRQTHSLERDFWCLLEAVYALRERLPLHNELEDGLRRVQRRNDASAGLAVELLIGLTTSREAITKLLHDLDRTVEGDALHLAQLLLLPETRADRAERLEKAGPAGQLLLAFEQDAHERASRKAEQAASGFTASAPQRPDEASESSADDGLPSLDLPAVDADWNEAPLYTGAHGALSQPLSSDALSTSASVSETANALRDQQVVSRHTPGAGQPALSGTPKAVNRDEQSAPGELRTLLSRAQYALTVEDTDELRAVDSELAGHITKNQTLPTALAALLQEDAEHLPRAAARLSDRYVSEKRWGDAAALLERVARLEDDQRRRGALYLEIAHRWLKAGEPNYAHEQLMVSFMCDPLNPRAIKLLEVSYRKRGAPEAAIEMYETAIQSAELANENKLADAMRGRVATLRERLVKS